MRILVIGDKIRFKEIQDKFGSPFEYILSSDTRDKKEINLADLIVDFLIQDSPHPLEAFDGTDKPVFLSIAKTCLRRISLFHPIKSNWVGFNGLPTFIDRRLLEISVFEKDQLPVVERLCKQLKTEYVVVDDRVGLVTPRVISMIINEAYYTNEEGTAEREDIDKAMKLGTNYPFGPFEWCKRIGVANVYEILQAVYEDTKDERYKISPSLKKEYLEELSLNRGMDN